MAFIRLDKYLADSGQGTRSKVKQLVRQGSVLVNGVTVKNSDLKINTETDQVVVNGKTLHFEEFSYYIMNKPAGVVSATTDVREKTVIDLIQEDKRRDLFPVGRLDKDTEGLLVITNDGKLANSLLAPGKHVDKEYFARVEGEVTDETVLRFQEGLDIGDDTLTKPAILACTEISEGISSVRITITEGRYHQIKRMFQAVGMEVLYLKRIRMGNLCLDETLSCGEVRKLTEQELAILKNEVE